MSKATFDPTHYNPSKNPPFSSILERELSRRALLKRGCGMAALSVFGGLGLSACSDSDDATDVLIDDGSNNFTSRYFFPIDGSSTDGLLCINHEYIDADALHPNGPSIDESAGRRTSAEEVRKEINAHGVTVVRIRLVGDVMNGKWYKTIRIIVVLPVQRKWQ